MIRPISAQTAALLGLAAAFTILAVDLSQSPGVAMAMPYIAIPLLGLLARAPRIIILLASAGSLLAAAGILLAGEGAAVTAELVNRGMAIMLTWGVASISVRHLAVGESLRESLERQASSDPLTGLYNRRHVFSLVSSELRRYQRYGERFALILIDADHFKRINDAHGHVAGDAALRRIAEICQESVRETDVAGRFGGEEFIILLPHTRATEGCNVAERIRRSLDETGVDWEGGNIDVTLSLGVAEVGPGAESFDELLKAADGALYAAKDAGRNRVAVAPVKQQSIADPSKAA